MPQTAAREEVLRSLAARIRDFCRAHADEKIIVKYAKYFREGYDAYGVDGELTSAEADAIVREYRETLGFEGFLDLGDLLMASGKYEESHFAIHFVTAFGKWFSKATLGRIGAWFDGGVQNWAISDGICGNILSPLLSRSLVALDDFGSWRGSPDRWKRRAVPVSMLALLKTGFDIDRMLDFIRPIMMDNERVVDQGLGWFLREAWKKHPIEVERFLLEWKDSAARLIFQYATERMTPEGKERFRRAKRQLH